MKKLFFDLLRVGLGIKNNLDTIPTEEQWQILYALSVKQSVVGICYAAFKRLGVSSFTSCSVIGMSRPTYMKWVATAMKIQQRNAMLSERCVELQNTLLQAGLNPTILKGQGLALLYGEELAELRQSGDIDVFVDCGINRALEYVKGVQDDLDWDYKHAHLKIFPDVEIELHYELEHVFNLGHNRRLRRWHRMPEVKACMYACTEPFTHPSAAFNVFYVLLHAYKHFFFTGVGLRQLIDYYFVLLSWKNSGEDSSIDPVKAIRDFGMEKFACGIMWIMQEVFLMESSLLPFEPDPKEGLYILKTVMRGGNFGKFDRNVKAKSIKKRRVVHNFHLFLHYPGEALWSVLSMAWHFIWKLGKKIELGA